RRLVLAARHRLDAGAVNLGGIGRVLDAERQRTGEEGREDDAVFGQHVIEKEQLDQKRRVADELGDERRRPGNDLQRHHLERRPDQPKRQGDEKAQHRRLDGHPQADEQDRQDGGREGEVGGGIPFDSEQHGGYLAPARQRPTYRSSSFMMAVRTKAMPKYMNSTMV